MNQPDRPRSHPAVAWKLPALAGLLVLALGLLLGGTALAQDATYVAQGAKPAGPDLVLWGFRALAALTLVAAAAMVLSHNPVVASLCLVGTLFCIGGLFLMLHATFLAAIQVLVYAGAIMVLFVFVVMSVGHRDREELGFGRGRLSKGLGIVAVAILLMRLIPLLKTAKLGPAATVPDGFGDVRSVGKLLFNEYLLPFEAISILLLVAIVGAVMITRRPTREPGQPPERKGV